MTIGILALQGDFEAHGRALDELGASWITVTAPEQFDDLGGLIIPGGESTTMLKLLTPELNEALAAFHDRGGAIYGTCAGTILLAREVRDPAQESLGLLDAVVGRNGYGRQRESAIVRRRDRGVAGDAVPEEMVFIRAPVIHSVGAGVRVLASVDGRPVFVEEGPVMATTFHPELTGDRSVHRRFLEKIKVKPV